MNNVEISIESLFEATSNLNDRVSSLERKVDAIVEFCKAVAKNPHHATEVLYNDLMEEASHDD